MTIGSLRIVTAAGRSAAKSRLHPAMYQQLRTNIGLPPVMALKRSGPPRSGGGPGGRSSAIHDQSQFRPRSKNSFPHPVAVPARQPHHPRLFLLPRRARGRFDAEDLVDQPPTALARGEHVGQRVVARARGEVEALVEFVARAQRAADEIPCESEDPRAVAGRNFARSAQVAVDELANSWIVELRLGGSG